MIELQASQVHIQLQMTFLSLVKMIPSKMLSRMKKKNLLTLLVRCREKGVKLDKDKLKLKMSKVPNVDHMLTKDGLGPGQSKVEAI